MQGNEARAERKVMHDSTVQAIGVHSLRKPENYGTLHPPLELEPRPKSCVFRKFGEILVFFTPVTVFDLDSCSVGSEQHGKIVLPDRKSGRIDVCFFLNNMNSLTG